MNELQVIQIINRSHHPLPTYKSSTAAGMDLAAFLPTGPLMLQPRIATLVPTGIYIAIPQGLEGQIRPRSGFSAHNGVIIPNAPGTIDSDYRGELKVLLMNLLDTPFEVEDGHRIAQLVVAPYVSVKWEPVDELGETERGTGGFGSTGVGD